MCDVFDRCVECVVVFVICSIYMCVFCGVYLCDVLDVCVVCGVQCVKSLICVCDIVREI